jgi:hypothetical protein
MELAIFASKGVHLMKLFLHKEVPVSTVLIIIAFMAVAPSMCGQIAKVMAIDVFYDDTISKLGLSEENSNVQKAIEAIDTNVDSVATDGTWGKNETSIYYNNGNVGIGTISPNYTLDVEGAVSARDGFVAGDITFQKNGEKLWRMYEDENGLYLESLKTGQKYIIMLQEIK